MGISVLFTPFNLTADFPAKQLGRKTRIEYIWEAKERNILQDLKLYITFVWISNSTSNDIQLCSAWLRGSRQLKVSWKLTVSQLVKNSPMFMKTILSYRNYKTPPFAVVLCQINPIRDHTTDHFNICLNIILASMPSSDHKYSQLGWKAVRNLGRKTWNIKAIFYVKD
jgi:hypothetical protein